MSGGASKGATPANGGKATAGKAPAGKAGAIADRGYTPYRGAHTPTAQRGRVVARHALRQTARQPWVIVTLVLALFPLLGFAGWLWLQGRIGSALPGAHASAPAPLLRSPDAVVQSFATHWTTLLLGFFMALFAGGGAIADDARAGAFQFYFARPLTRDQYLWGKLVAVVTLTGLVTLAPPVLLALYRVSQAASPSELLGALPLCAATIAIGLVQALALAAPALALSSLSKRRGLMQAAYAGLVLLPWIAGAILASLTRSAWPTIVSLPAHFDNLGRALYRQPLEDGKVALPAWISAAVVAALVAGALALARRRLASVEVVAS